MKLVYLTTLQYPSPYANRVNVMKMAAAFNELADDFTLVIGPLLARKEEVFESYGIKRPFTMEVLGPSPALWPKSFFSALRIKKMIQRHPPETIYYIRDFLLAYVLSFVSVRFRRNFFVECHALDKFPSFVYRRVFRHAKGIISSNGAKREKINHDYSTSLARIIVEPNGFDEMLFSQLPSRQNARMRLGFSQDKKIVLYAGSMLDWKGTDIIADIAKELPDILFMIVGTNAEKQEGNLIFIKKQDLRRVPMYLRAADFLIAPYRSDSLRAQRYFSPIKVFEYMASGTPFAVTELPAVREFLSDDDAWLVAEWSASAFARAIRGAFARPEEMTKRAAHAKEKSYQFSWQKRAARIIRFLQSPSVQ